MNNIFAAISAALFVTGLAASPAHAATEDANLPIVGSDGYAAFEKKMTQEHGFSQTELRALFAKVEYKQSIIDAISRPAEGTMTWERYQRIFLKQNRVTKGVTFWNENQTALTRAQEQFGVDPAIIVAIIAVETRYGDITGGYRVLDALTTLGFHYPKRATFFGKQLEQIMLISRNEGFDPLELKGSYAGAMGLPQFIPTSYRDFAIDFDGDGIRDLWSNRTDAIGSVANYFAEHNWKAGDAVAQPVSVTGEQWKAVLGKHGKPSHSGLELTKLGVQIPAGVASNSQLGLLEFEGNHGLEHWISNNNFYVITRYNHSKLYAMAVLQLAEKIRSSYATQ